MSKIVKGKDATVRIEGVDQEFRFRDFDANRRHSAIERIIRADRAKNPHASGCTCRNDCGGWCGIDRGVHLQRVGEPSIGLTECPTDGCEAMFKQEAVGTVCPACAERLYTLGDGRKAP